MSVIPVKVSIVAARKFSFPSRTNPEQQVEGKIYYALTEDGKIEFSAPLDSKLPASKKIKYDPTTAITVHLVCTGFNYSTNQLKYRLATEDEQNSDE